MIEYVVGLAFRGLDLVLIQRKRPAYMAGLYNGVGGKVEQGESEHDAMVRKFKEKTGALTAVSDWDHFATLRGEDKRSPYGFIIYVFRAFFDKLDVKTMTDEVVAVSNAYVWLSHWSLLMPHLRYLIPMALDPHLNVAALQFRQVEQKEEEKQVVFGG